MEGTIGELGFDISKVSGRIDYLRFLAQTSHKGKKPAKPERLPYFSEDRTHEQMRERHKFDPRLWIDKYATHEPYLILDLMCGGATGIAQTVDPYANSKNLFTFGIDTRYYTSPIGEKHFMVGNVTMMEKIVQHEGRWLGIPDNTFDFIISTCSLFLLGNGSGDGLEKAISESLRILKEDGVIMAEVPLSCNYKSDHLYRRNGIAGGQQSVMMKKHPVLD